MKPVVIRYKNGYWVKFSFGFHKETEDEGNGWYSYTGKKFLWCRASRIKFSSQIPENEGNIEDLNEDCLRLFKQEKELWESSPNHKNCLKSNPRIK